MADYQKQIHKSFWQGMVKLVILHQTSSRPVYGGMLSKYLRKQGYKISPGSLYPLLHSLEREGYLRSHIKLYKGRVRKYYEATLIGQSCLNELQQQFNGIVREVILNSSPKELYHPSKSLDHNNIGKPNFR
jgi:PadR family transcriptional regulator PadR